MGAKGRRGRRPWGPDQERLHPRDNRGRFAKTGGSNWVEKVLSHHVAAFGDISANDPKHAIRTGDGFFDPQGGPRAGRGPGGLIDLKKLRDNASVAKSVRDYQAGVRNTPLENIGIGQQIKVDGEWRDVYSVGSGGGKHNIGWRDRTGTKFGEITEDTHPYVEMRNAPPEFRPKVGELSREQQAQMDAWRADAQKPAPFSMPTRAENLRRREQASIDKAQAEYDAAFNKARKAALKKYPASDGYTRRDRDRYSREDAERETHYERGHLQYAKDSAQDVATQQTDPEGVDVYAWPDMHGKLDRSRPLAVYGDMLHAQDESRASHRSLEDLAGIPAEVHAIVAGAAVAQRARLERRRAGGEQVVGEPGIYVGSAGVNELDHLGDLSNEQPRGWHEGATWKEVNGVFQPKTFTVGIGHTHNADLSGHSAAEHELGHALDHAIAERRRTAGLYDDPRGASFAPEWRALHARAVASPSSAGMNPYFRQGGDAGPEELWAEAFAVWSKAYYKLMRRNASGHAHHGDDSPERITNLVGRALRNGLMMFDDDISNDMHEYFMGLMKSMEGYL